MVEPSFAEATEGKAERVGFDSLSEALAKERSKNP